MRAIITVGASASGKTTWADEFVIDNPEWVVVNRDDVRFRLFCNGERDWNKYKFTKANEKRVTEEQEIQLVAALEKNLIISDTNLNPGHRANLVQRLETLGYDVEFKEFDVPLEELWKRDSRRQNGVGHSVIYRQYQQFLKYKGRRVYESYGGIECPAIICDIDGTIAEAYERGHYEWDKVGNDLPVGIIMDIVDGYRAKGYTIVFLSGRDGICRKETEEWLTGYFDFPITLFMRGEGDNRKDTIIKEELFWEYIEPDYRVDAAIDDRPCMVRLWLELGIKTICVGNPYIEF